MAAIERDVTTCRTSRAKVYEAIDSEREYQDRFVIPELRYYQTHTLGEFILMINQYAAQAQDKWTHHEDAFPPSDGFPISLHEVRKIAALAVRCMEQHGAPLRELPAAMLDPGR
jgi:hypothetical protein